jgi:hypothetical protein
MLLPPFLFGIVTYAFGLAAGRSDASLILPQVIDSLASSMQQRCLVSSFKKGINQ